ncbi:MAG: hypothetical protein WC026_06840 [Hyphomicrobium sp.]|uniref:hypothetical protein n=1 Tax=Hyphomicrobium sp. TaxID=82 RepID=UPI003567E1E4
MLTKILRYLLTSTVLLTMAVAGLPVIVCVSDAHGAVIEVGRVHNLASTSHRAFVNSAHQDAQSQPCSDFQFDHGTLSKQEEHRPTSHRAGGEQPHLSLERPGLSSFGPPVDGRRNSSPGSPPGLRERRTIVLQI